MNPTHDTYNNPAQPRAFGENFLADLFTDRDRFRAWIASATDTSASRGTTSSETESIGWVITDVGREALEHADAESLCATAAWLIRGTTPDQLVSDDGEPFFERLSDPVTGTNPSTAPVDLVTETDDETTARVLCSAALYLDRHGWIQRAYYDSASGSFTPPACLVGAIGMVCYGGPVDAPAQHFDDPGFLDFEQAVLHLDRYLLVENGSESYEFNDARGRRVDDVTRVLRDAAGRPAHELIDALRVIDQHNADTAALADMLVPNGVERCPCCASSRRALHGVIDDGDGAAFCGHDWHDGDSQGGDVR